MYQCLNCGSFLTFDISQQKMKCKSCDSTFSVCEFPDESLKEKEFETNVFECSQCGGTIYTQENDMTGKCSYCGSTQIFINRVEKIQRPKLIIPFQKDKSACKNIYKNAVKKAFYAPRDVKNEEYIDSLRGIYMPYWIYDCIYDKNLDLTGYDRQGVKREGKIVTFNNYNIKTKYKAEFLAMQEDASSWYSDEISVNIRPFHLNRSERSLQDFNPAFLCGFYGETADVDRPAEAKAKTFHEQAVKSSEDYFHTNLVNTYIFDGNYHPMKDPTKSGMELGLLPVWFLSHRKGKRVSYSVINGQTGHLAAEFPVDIVKFLLCTFATAGILFMLLNLFWIMRPEYVAMTAAIAALWSIRFAKRDLIEIARKEWDSTPTVKKRNLYKPSRISKFVKKIDLIPLILVLCLVLAENMGYIDRHPKGFMTWLPLLLTLWAVILSSKEIWHDMAPTRYLLRNLKAGVFPGYFLAYLSILITLGIQIYHPVSDFYYFAAGYFCMIMSLVSLLCVVLSFNRMASRPMPQFSHMGGDDSAK
ncbi:MAG: hypothetical protein Q4E53_07915 [Eubacteriales bacterium]|nr:hypothetical protein [Eubacteriales bacterium]